FIASCTPPPIRSRHCNARSGLSSPHQTQVSRRPRAGRRSLSSELMPEWRSRSTEPMPVPFTLIFEGLCGFVKRDATSTIEVNLIGAPPHTATLTVPSQFIKMGLSTWKPTRVGLYPTAVGRGGVSAPIQFAQWDLKGLEITIADPGSAAGVPQW